MAEWGEAQRYLREHLNDQTDECMIWPYAVADAKRPYGVVRWEGRNQHVHVIACIAHHGPRPPGMLAAHGVCHNPRCWNGRHLSWRTHAENVGLDRTRDGTSNSGERHGMARLTSAEVTEIRRLASERQLTHRQIGARFGVTKHYVWAIVNGHARASS